MTGTHSASSTPLIIIPVHDEIVALERTSKVLLEGLPEGARIVYVCNGCSDGSAAFLRALGDGRITVLERSQPSKSLALRAGEAACALFPRFYVDADVEVSGASIAAMCEILETHPGVDLVSPRLTFDQSRSSPLARRANAVWLNLPHGEKASFQQVMGVSRRGRTNWGVMPQVTADDSFIAAQIAPARQRKIDTLSARVRPPASLASLFGVRLRILKGLRELETLGVARPRAPGQRQALVRALLDPEHCLGAITYVGVTVAARIAFACGLGRERWYRDTGSRQPRGSEPA